MPLIDQITNLVTLLDEMIQVGVIGSEDQGRLSTQEKITLDLVNFGALMLGMAAQALKLAELDSNLSLGLLMAQTLLGTASQVVTYELSTRNTSGLREQKRVTPVEILQKHQKNMPEAMKALTAPALKDLGNLADLIFGDELRTTSIPILRLSGPLGLQNIGQNLEGLGSKQKLRLVNAFTKACKTYIGRSWKSIEDSDAADLLVPY